MNRLLIRALFVAPLLLLPPQGAVVAGADESHTAAALRFLHGVYACGTEAVEELAGEDIVISYPIFETIFGTPSIRGHDAAVAFAKRFCSRWTEAEFTIHETVAEGNCVVVLWSFQARSVAPGPNGEPPTNEIERWGGITFYRFDDDGKIVLEVGEESNPGPFARISAEDN